MLPTAIYVFGRGHGAVETLEDVRWIYNGSEIYNPNIVFVEDEPNADKVTVCGEEYLLRSTEEVQITPNCYGHITPFTPKYKEKLDKKFGDFIKWINAISSTASGSLDHIGFNARPYVFVGTSAKVGRHVKVNFYSMIAHTVEVGDYSFISHHVGLGGATKIGKSCEIYEGTMVLPGITIGDNTIIGANSTVTKDIPANVVAYGSPCKVVRDND